MHFENAPGYHAVVLWSEIDAPLIEEISAKYFLSAEVMGFLSDCTIGAYRVVTYSFSIDIIFDNELDLVHFKMRFYKGKPNL